MRTRRILSLPLALMFFFLFLGILIVIPFLISGAFRLLGLNLSLIRAKTSSFTERIQPENKAYIPYSLCIYCKLPKL